MKYKILLMLLLLSIIATGCKEMSTTPEQFTPIEKEPDIIVEKELEDNFVDEIPERSFPTQCNENDWNCVEDYAYTIRDISYCHILPRMKIQSCDNKIAMAEEDISLCGSDDRCKLYVAYRVRDQKICNQISNKNVNLECEAVLTKNEELCKEISGVPWWIDNCVENIAFLKDDSSLCVELSDTTYKNRCLSSLNKDSNYCNNDDSCLTTFALRISKSACNEISNDNMKQLCFAYTEKDITKCNENRVCQHITELLISNDNVFWTNEILQR